MRMNKVLITVMILLSSWFASITVCVAANQNDPVNLLQSIADNMISGLKQNKATLKTKPESVYRLAYRFVVPYADLAEMSRRVLPPQIWKNASAAQRAQFQKQFTVTLIRTYASALSAYQDQTVKFYPVRGSYQGAKSIEVNGTINGAEQPIQVTYRLVRAASGWRLYDMSVEGVSMLESFRSQFANILESGSMDELLRRMDTHNSR